MAARMATPDLGKRRTELQKHVRGILELIGEDPDREGLLSTPKRVAEAYAELSAGYHADLDKVLNKAIFHEDCSEMILVKDIELYSLCEHHMLPFVGRAHVAYIPNGKIVGLSKIPRIVDVFARRLQVQERLTTQVAQAIECFLQPLGVGVVVEAAHYCMMMRGVQKQNSVAITSCMLGQMHDDSRSRMEFLNLLGHSTLKG